MIIRLTVLTSLIALFALGFSILVQNDGRNANAWAGTLPGSGCFDKGAVCAARMN